MCKGEPIEDRRQSYSEIGDEHRYLKYIKSGRRLSGNLKSKAKLTNASEGRNHSHDNAIIFFIGLLSMTDLATPTSNLSSSTRKPQLRSMEVCSTAFVENGSR
jgi:hypothetical protein